MSGATQEKANPAPHVTHIMWNLIISISSLEKEEGNKAHWWSLILYTNKSVSRISISIVFDFIWLKTGVSRKLKRTNLLFRWISWLYNFPEVAILVNKTYLYCHSLFCCNFCSEKYDLKKETILYFVLGSVIIFQEFDCILWFNQLGIDRTSA